MTADNPYNIKKEVDKSQQQEFTRILELVQREARDVAALKDKNRPLRRRLPTRQSLLKSPSDSSVPATPSHTHAHTRAPISLVDIEKAQEEKAKKLYMSAPLSQEFAAIPDYYYTIQDLNQVSTLKQKLSHVQVQAPSIRDLIPVKKLLHTRRSKRCRKCDQLLIKPDLNFAAKIEFKRLRIAYTTLPRVMVARALQVVERGIMAELVIVNPLHTIAELTFSSVQLPFHNSQLLETPPATFILGLPEEDDDEENADVLAARKAQDDPRFILRRAKNKICLVITIVPTASAERTQFGLGVSVQFQDATAVSQTTSFRLDFDFLFPSHLQHNGRQQLWSVRQIRTSQTRSPRRGRCGQILRRATFRLERVPAKQGAYNWCSFLDPEVQIRGSGVAL